MTPFIEPYLIEHILDRLDLPDRPEISYEGLCRFYQRWCRNVPFDNFLKRLFLKGDGSSEFPGNNDSLFFRNWLAYGTGGTCWAGNGALQTVLAGLGFNAERRRGTMLIGQVTDPDHGSVTVQLEGGLYLVDASMLHVEPLELRPRKNCQISGAWGVACRPEGEDWVIRWRPLHLPGGCFCRIENNHIGRQEWRARNHLARAVSPFNTALYARKVIDDAVVGVEHGARTVFHGDGRVTRDVLTHRQILECLADEMGYSPEFLAGLPEDDRPA